jgi:hypothetical protein
LDEKLAPILKGDAKPADAAEHLALAHLCRQYKRFYAAATQLYASAFAAEPTLADDLAGAHRYNAACSAALAGAGKGLDPNRPDAKDQRRLREQALDWLRADLDRLGSQSRAGQGTDVLLVLERLTHWPKDADLASVRDPEGLAALPAVEREAWLKLWADVNQLRKEVRASVMEIAFKGTLTDKESEHVHELRPEAGKTYVIDMHSTSLDSYLKLLDAKGKVLDENDDIAPGDFDSRLIFTPKEDGTYRIVATSFQNEGRGGYTLTIRVINPQSRRGERPDGVPPRR